MEHHDKTSIEHDIGKTMGFSQVFTGAESFDAVNAAEKWLTKHGYSYGVMQQNAPIGIAKNTGRISKWYNLGSDTHRLDGAIVSDDFRDGPVTVYLERAPRGAGGHASRAPRKPRGKAELEVAYRAARIAVEEAVRASANAGNAAYPAASAAYKQARAVADALHSAVARARGPRKPSGRTTLATAKKDLAALGMSLRKSDGEYRVTFRGAKPGRAEEVAYYTDSIDDAVATGRAMSKERAKV